MIEQRQFKKVRFSDCMKTVAISVGLAVSAIIPSFASVLLLGTSRRCWNYCFSDISNRNILYHSQTQIFKMGTSDSVDNIYPNQLWSFINRSRNTAYTSKWIMVQKSVIFSFIGCFSKYVPFKINYNEKTDILYVTSIHSSLWVKITAAHASR